jgi:hypothetical protein
MHPESGRNFGPTGVSRALALLLLAGTIMIVLPSCSDGGPPPGKKADGSGESGPAGGSPPAEAGTPADTPAPPTPAQAAAPAESLAKLQRFQRAIVSIEASAPYRRTVVGREPEMDEKEFTAHFGSSPAFPTKIKLRRPVTWEGTTFRVQGEYAPPTEISEEDETRTDALETVDITGQVDPTCTKILWLKASRTERYLCEGTGELRTSMERRVNLRIEAGEIPRVSHSDDRGWLYELDGEEIKAVRAFEYGHVYTTKSVDPDAEGKLLTESSESKTIGKLPDFGKLSVEFYKLPE